MSVLNGVYFCNKCNRSIPRGEFRLKGVCEHCFTKGRTIWQRIVVGAILFIMAAGAGSIWGLMDTNTLSFSNQARIEAESIDRDIQILEEMRERTDLLIDACVSLQKDIEGLQIVSAVQAERISSIKDTISDVKATLAGASSKSDVTAQEIRVEELARYIKELKDEVTAMQSLPIETIEHSILNPTIMIEVREKNMRVPVWKIGTAVIIGRTQITRTDGKDAPLYEYVGITDSHLFNDIFGYLQNTRPKQPKEKQLDPEFWMAHYDGLNSRNPDFFRPIEVVFPDPHYVSDKVWENRDSACDFAIFKFTCECKWDVAELASNEDMAKMKPNDKVFNASCFPSERPALTTGIVAALHTNMYNDTMAFQCSVNPGSSGSPVFILVDGKPKVAGLIQVISVSQVGGNSVLAYCSRIDNIRRYVGVAKPQVKELIK